MRLSGLSTLVLTALLLGVVPGQAAEFPNGAVRIVVPSTPGGGLDVLARLIARPLGERWHQPVVVDDRAGAGGIVGTGIVATAPPNGQTLLLVTTGFTNNPFLYKALPYRTPGDFAPITIVATNADVLVVNPKAPFRTLQELIAAARAAPGQISYGSSGVGGGGHLGLSLLQSLAGVKLVHVPYRGAGAALTGVVSGEVPVLMTAVGAALPNIRSGTLVAIAVTGRSVALPDVPTFAEAGLPEYRALAWQGLLAPAGTPEGIVAQIHDDVAAVLQEPELAARLKGLGYDLDPISPAAFRQFLTDDLKRAEITIRAAGIAPE